MKKKKKKKKKTLKTSSKQKIYPIKKKKYVLGRIGRISYDPTILYDPTIFSILVRF